MCKQHKKGECKKHPSIILLDTLAQLGTPSLQPSSSGNPSESLFCTKPSKEEHFKIDFPELTKGTDFDDKRRLKNRAKRKSLASYLSLGLVDLVNMRWKEEQNRYLTEGKSRRALYYLDEKYKSVLKSYWSMYHCCQDAEKVGNKFKSEYCGNRLCLVCNSIRTAELTNKYKPVFDKWIKSDEVYFVTATIPNCKAKNLESSIREMIDISVKIQGTLKKRHQRNKGVKVLGFRKLECTYNPERDDYHPHFHFIIKGKEAAQQFFDMWLKYTNHLGTKESAQDIRVADAGAVQELFKYFTKVVSASSKEGKDRAIYLHAVHEIFMSIKKIRTFQYFGFNPSDYVSKEANGIDKKIVIEAEQLTDYEPEYFPFILKKGDWIQPVTKEQASGHTPSKSLMDIVNSMVLPKKEVSMLIDDFLENRDNFSNDKGKILDRSHLSDDEKRGILNDDLLENIDSEKVDNLRIGFNDNKLNSSSLVLEVEGYKPIVNKDRKYLEHFSYSKNEDKKSDRDLYSQIVRADFVFRLHKNKKPKGTQLKIDYNVKPPKLLGIRKNIETSKLAIGQTFFDLHTCKWWVVNDITKIKTPNYGADKKDKIMIDFGNCSRCFFNENDSIMILEK